MKYVKISSSNQFAYIVWYSYILNFQAQFYMEFSFGILSYNQEKTILETLESIRYQIENYGQGHKFYLYISDDYSKDDTVSIVNKWINKYNDYFLEAKVLVSSQNKGTCVSYKKILSCINTELFKVIAGDDVFSEGNLFEDFCNLKNVNFAIAYYPLIIRNDSLSISYDLLFRNFLYKNINRNNKYDIQRMILGGYFNTPSFFFNKNLINDSCTEFLNQFVLFEDDPTWYKLLSTNSNLSIKFINKTKVLYRVNSSTASNSQKVNSQWCKDYITLKNYFLDNEKISIFTWIYLKSAVNHYKYALEHDHYKRYDSFTFLSKIMSMFFKYKSNIFMNSSTKYLLQENLELNTKYYEKIRINAKKLFKEYKSC